jgi:hypothetical protein
MKKKKYEEDNCKLIDKRFPKTYVAKSTFPNAGKGLFAGEFIQKNRIINEYRGKKLNEEQFEKLKNKDYVWQVLNKEKTKTIFFIDGRRLLRNNPLRYVNGPKLKSQYKYVNAYAFQRNRKLYYCAMYDIKPNQEIVIYYGDDYW